MSEVRDGKRIRHLLAHNMKRIRKRMKISQSELAERCNVSTSFIAEIEIYRKFPSPATLDKIADALNLQPYQLFLDEWNWEIRDQAGLIHYIHGELKQRIMHDIDVVMSPYIT